MSAAAKYAGVMALLLWTVAGTGGLSARGPAGAMLRFTVLYDNYLYQDGTKADWGFSCLVEGPEKTILFDTGTSPDILIQNVDALRVDLRIGDIDRFARLIRRLKRDQVLFKPVQIRNNVCLFRLEHSDRL